MHYEFLKMMYGYICETMNCSFSSFIHCCKGKNCIELIVKTVIYELLEEQRSGQNFTVFLLFEP